MYFSEVKGEEKVCQGVSPTPKNSLVQKLIKKATGRTDVCNLYLYGCWCGDRGHGKYVDDFD